MMDQEYKQQLIISQACYYELPLKIIKLLLQINTEIRQQQMMPMQPKQVTDSQSLNDISSEDEMDSVHSPVSFQDEHFSPPILQKSSKFSNSLPQLIVDKDLRHQDTISLMLQIKEVNHQIEKHNHKQVQCHRDFLKEIVSKEKKRFMMDGFNLDLTYITPNIIAMGFPAENYESIYRNSLPDVQKFLNSRHPNLYKVYNLCSERKYKHDHFDRVAEFPFDDHQAPPFKLIGQFCQDMHDWLKCDKNRVSAVHCKAGKGRTGVMICCYLLYIHKFESAKDVLRYYGLIRTQDSKGVTIPSQIRYVEYFNEAIQNNQIFRAPRTLELVSATLYGLPNFGIFGGCDPFIRIQNGEKQLIKTEQEQIEKEIGECHFRFQNVFVQGDILIQFFHQSIVSDKKMFQLWINTNFGGLLQNYKRNELDCVSKDKNYKIFPKNLELELKFQIPIENRRRSNCVFMG